MSRRLEMGWEVPLPVEEWVGANLEFIARNLEEQRLKLLGRHSNIPPSALNLDERWPSEMPLCGAWKRIKKDAGLPSGLKLNWTEVFVFGGDPFGPQRGHFFAASPEDDVLCITPGQFVHADGRLLKPGDRVLSLKQKAPELITHYDGGIAVLYGTKQEIGKRLGIWY